MQVSVSTDIMAPREDVWKVITDIENSEATISGIDAIEVIEQATGPSIVGLKWRETRTMFGKPATEVMWITEAVEPAHYDTRAESHGAVYTTRMALDAIEGGTRLTMSFKGDAQTTGAKIMWALTGWMAKGAMRKTCKKDLDDIKAAVEA